MYLIEEMMRLPSYHCLHAWISKHTARVGLSFRFCFSVSVIFTELRMLHNIATTNCLNPKPTPSSMKIILCLINCIALQKTKLVESTRPRCTSSSTPLQDHRGRNETMRIALPIQWGWWKLLYCRMYLHWLIGWVGADPWESWNHECGWWFLSCYTRWVQRSRGVCGLLWGGSWWKLGNWEAAFGELYTTSQERKADQRFSFGGWLPIFNPLRVLLSCSSASMYSLFFPAHFFSSPQPPAHWFFFQ